MQGNDLLFKLVDRAKKATAEEQYLKMVWFRRYAARGVWLNSIHRGGPMSKL